MHFHVRTVGGTGLMVLSRWAIVDTGTFDFSFNGMMHRIFGMESWAQGSAGLAKIETPSGLRINAYVAHLMSDPTAHQR